MEDGETIFSMQMRFTHIVNKLQNLGKKISNQDLTNKILGCMTKEWQPKVTAIKESQNLDALSMITLFENLKENEHEITQFKSSEEEGKLKDKKLVVFNVFSSKASSSIVSEGDSGGESPNEEDMVLFVKRFNRYIKKHGLRSSDKNSRRSQTKGENSKGEIGLSCFGCGKVGHLRSECPDLIKSKGGRAYIAWEEDEKSSTKSDSENDEIAQLCFMGQRKKSIEVSDRNSKPKPSYDELQNFLVEMHGNTMNAYKTIGNQKRTILKLEAEIATIMKYFENFKNEHASLKKELFETPLKESPTIDVPKPSKDEDINVFLACPRLQLEIVSLRSKMEQVSNASINFENRFTKTLSFKKKF